MGSLVDETGAKLSFIRSNQSFDANGIQFAFDQTSIKLAEECLQKYKYRMIDGWRPRGTSVHLFFGGAYASALEHFHKYRAQGMEHDEALIEVVREALIATWIDGAPWVSDHNTKTRENLIRTIVWYFEQFKDDPCQTVILSDGTAAVEHSFRLPVDNDIILCGHLDRLVDYDRKTLIQDQKTTGSTITPRFFDNFNPDDQITGMYPFAGRAVFGLPIKGVMIDGAQIAVGFSRFERGFIFVDDAQLDEWYDEAMFHILRAQEATRNNYFPKNRTSCHKYAGCEFRGACARSPHVREQFLKADFERSETWDPLLSR